MLWVAACREGIGWAFRRQQCNSGIDQKVASCHFLKPFHFRLEGLSWAIPPFLNFFPPNLNLIYNFDWNLPNQFKNSKTCPVCLTSIYHPQIGSILLRLLVDQPTIFMVALASLWSELVNTIIKKSWHHWKVALNSPPMRRWVNERVVLNFTLGISKSKLEIDGNSLRLK